MSSNTQLPVFTAEVPHLTEAQFNYFFGDLVQKILEKSNKNKKSSPPLPQHQGRHVCLYIHIL